jgi:hypothetical protein
MLPAGAAPAHAACDVRAAEPDAAAEAAPPPPPRRCGRCGGACPACDDDDDDADDVDNEERAARRAKAVDDAHAHHAHGDDDGDDTGARALRMGVFVGALLANYAMTHALASSPLRLPSDGRPRWRAGDFAGASLPRAGPTSRARQLRRSAALTARRSGGNPGWHPCDVHTLTRAHTHARARTTRQATACASWRLASCWAGSYGLIPARAPRGSLPAAAAPRRSCCFFSRRRPRCPR